MKRAAGALVLSVVLVFASIIQSTAEILPSFYLQPATWHATDIIAVDEGEVIDGRMTVTEVFCGSLKTGDLLLAPALKKFAEETWRTEGQSLYNTNEKWAKDDKKKTVMSCRKVLLFLKRLSEEDKPNGKQEANQVTVEGHPDVVWVPANFFGPETSAAWIEGGKVYSFVQWRNPGPSLLSDIGCDEKATLTIIRKLCAARDELGQIESLDDKVAACERAFVYVESEFTQVADRAFDVIGRCGRPAVNPLRRILEDPQKAKFHVQAVCALGLIDGKEVEDQLLLDFQAEIKHWQEFGPKLKVGWWNGTGLDWKKVDEYRREYCKTLEYVYVFQKRALKGAREPLDRFRRLWRSLPQLEDSNGLDQMSKACDAAIMAIKKAEEK